MQDRCTVLERTHQPGTLNFICSFVQSRAMKIIAVILSILLAGSMLGYGMHASAQTPCTASQPCAPICGDHICGPGETPGSATTSSSAKVASQSTNQTGGPSIATQMSISANMTVTKNANSTMTTNGTSYKENMTMGTNVTVAKSSNGTMTSTMPSGAMTNSTMTSGTMTNGTMTTGSMSSGTTSVSTPTSSPNAQVAAGAQPANVKCPSGFYLVINNSNSRPACVTQNTMSVLEARGWGHAVA